MRPFFFTAVASGLLAGSHVLTWHLVYRLPVRLRARAERARASWARHCARSLARASVPCVRARAPRLACARAARLLALWHERGMVDQLAPSSTTPCDLCHWPDYQNMSPRDCMGALIQKRLDLPRFFFQKLFRRSCLFRQFLASLLLVPPVFVPELLNARFPVAVQDVVVNLLLVCVCARVCCVCA